MKIKKNFEYNYKYFFTSKKNYRYYFYKFKKVIFPIKLVAKL